MLPFLPNIPMPPFRFTTSEGALLLTSQARVLAIHGGKQGSRITVTLGGHGLGGVEDRVTYEVLETPEQVEALILERNTTIRAALEAAYKKEAEAQGNEALDDFDTGVLRQEIRGRRKHARMAGRVGLMAPVDVLDDPELPDPGNW